VGGGDGKTEIERSNKVYRRAKYRIFCCGFYLGEISGGHFVGVITSLVEYVTTVRVK